jgi:hypothetical protein
LTSIRRGCHIPRSIAVKQKHAGIVCRVAIAFSLASLGFASVAAQSSGDRPDKVFWPREVKLSEGIKLEQKTKYGLVTSKRSPGAVVKVIGLDSDLLRVESDGFLGTVRVEMTDFWERAERAKDTALEREKREKAAAQEREKWEAQATKPRPSPKTAETYKPELLIGMTRERMLVLMGQPIELITGSHPTDRGFKIYSYSKEKGKETYFTIWDDEGVIDNGMYQGVYFFKK